MNDELRRHITEYAIGLADDKVSTDGTDKPAYAYTAAIIHILPNTHQEAVSLFWAAYDGRLRWAEEL